MESILQDLRYAVRVLRKSAGFTILAVLTLALAIGAATAMFSVVYGVLLRPLPYANPSRIMAIHEVNTQGGWSRLADLNFDDFRDQNRSFEAIAKYNAGPASVSGGSQPTRSTLANVTPQFLRVFGLQPIIGRDLRSEDGKKGAAPVVLVEPGILEALSRIVDRPFAAAPEDRQCGLLRHRRTSRKFRVSDRRCAVDTGRPGWRKYQPDLS